LSGCLEKFFNPTRMIFMKKTLAIALLAVLSSTVTVPAVYADDTTAPTTTQGTTTPDTTTTPSTPDTSSGSATTPGTDTQSGTGTQGPDTTPPETGSDDNAS
jgi:hypothetical protein